MRSKLLTTALAMLAMFGISYWAYPSWTSSLVAALAVGLLSVVNIFRMRRKTANHSGKADMTWYVYGSSIVFWIAVFVISWLIHH